MERRDVLKSASTVAAASTVGLAGCGILGGGCDTPGDNLEDSLPDSDDYEEQETFSEPSEDQEDAAAGFYVGPDDGEFIFSVVEYDSSDTASEEAENASSEGTEGGAFGYIQTGAYIFGAAGPDEDAVTEFMKTSPTLSDGCVDNNIEFI
jgi:hypothetical protein